MFPLANLPNDLIEKIISIKIRNDAAKKIQWYFREQNKLEVKFFELLNKKELSFENINSCLNIHKRLHLNEDCINYTVFERITLKIMDFTDISIPSNSLNDGTVALQLKYAKTFESGVAYLLVL